MEKKLVSILVSVYNVEKYLEECLDSLIYQTYKNLEIILVNDGSTDNSLDIINMYIQKDPRIVLINQDNHGAGYSRNIGFDNATGEYVIFFDSDDYMRQDAIELLLNQALKTDADIVLAKSKSYCDKTKKIDKMDYAIRCDRINIDSVFNFKTNGKYVFNFCIGWAWDKLYKREFLLKYNLKFQNINYANDGYFVCHSLSLADKISILNEYIFYHRINNPLSISNFARDKDPLEGFKSLFKIKEGLEKDGTYNNFEQSFINMSIGYVIWHSSTIGETSRELVILYMKVYIFKLFNILDKPEEYFYEENYYKWINKIKNNEKYDQFDFKDFIIYSMGYEFINIWKNKSIKSIFKCFFAYLFFKTAKFNFSGLNNYKEHLSYKFGYNIAYNKLRKLLKTYKEYKNK
ncbi:glycosyltransferase family 2 protein [Campylobacter volucris]|uniref:glycosyltransferase family 2 protein n=1 Tax=Campylobacter volucris TaxID=1031542 RepID=UPI000581C6A6|nr:glycosyltransferase family 2 protein [Campylobacter volucris]AJC93642.1 glycosyltransferase, family 2 [Campylobacter volucris LMG 24379]QEL07855.1 glycosyltransferase, family 2 [Campylobacter volucris]